MYTENEKNSKFILYLDSGPTKEPIHHTALNSQSNPFIGKLSLDSVCLTFYCFTADRQNGRFEEEI